MSEGEKDRPARKPVVAPCPNCKKEFAVAGLPRHVRSCMGLEVQKTAEEIAKRREKVWLLRMRGVPPAVMAPMFGVSVRTIQDDVTARRHEMMEALGTTSMAERVAEELMRLQTLEVEAAQDYAAQDAEKAPGHRTTAHKEILDTLLSRLKFMQESGLLPKKADELRLLPGDRDYGSMSRQALEVERRRVLKELEQLGPVDQNLLAAPLVAPETEGQGGPQTP